MIVDKLKPSHFWSAMATTVRTKAFNCFVSTARRAFIWTMWLTQIYLGDPGVDKDFKKYCRVVYARGYTREQVYKLHDDLSTEVDLRGERGQMLSEVMASVVERWSLFGIIQPIYTKLWR